MVIQADPATLSNQIEKIRKRFQWTESYWWEIEASPVNESTGQSVEGLVWISALLQRCDQKLADAEGCIAF